MGYILSAHKIAVIQNILRADLLCMGSHQTRLSTQLRDRWCHGAVAEDDTPAGSRISESGEREAAPDDSSAPVGTCSTSSDAVVQDVMRGEGRRGIGHVLGQEAHRVGGIAIKYDQVAPG